MTPLDEEFYADDTQGGRLLAAREETGISLEKLARLLRVPVESVRHWECDRSAPSTEYIVRIADILGVRPFWLMSGEVEKPQTASGHHGVYRQTFTKSAFQRPNGVLRTLN